MEYFFDSYAIIEIIGKNEKYEKFIDCKLITSELNLGEVYYYLLKTFGKEKADFWYEYLNAEILCIDSNIVINSMIFKYKNKKKKLSMVDCIGYNLALKNKITFLTGDEGFKDISGVEFVK